jgi:histidine triad (HIT) family protein
MSTIFTKIVEGEIPSYKVAESEDFLAFLDIFPLKKGHVLVIPKKEVDYLFDLDDKTYADLWSFANKVAKGLERAISCKRIGIAVLGMEVPHAHIHLVPLDHEGDLNFRNPKLKFTSEEFKAIADQISAEI